jgi:hypothetical protein
MLRHPSIVTAANFSPNNRMVATTSADGTARVWATETGEPITPPLQHGNSMYSPTWHSNSQLLITMSVRSVYIWDVARGQQVLPPLKGSRAWLSADQEHIVTAGDAVRIWRLTPDNRPIQDLMQLGHLFSGSYIDKVGGLSPLDLPTQPAPTTPQTNFFGIVQEFVSRGKTGDHPIVALWNKLRGKYPEDFQVTREEIVAWHEREVAEAEHEKDSFGASFHLKILKELQGTNASVAGRLENAAGDAKTALGRGDP